MQDALWRLQAVVMELEEKSRRETVTEVDDLEATFERRLSIAEATSYVPREKVLSSTVRERFGIYIEHIQARLRSGNPNDHLVTDVAWNERTMRLAREVAEPCRKLVDLDEEMLADGLRRSDQLFSFTNWLRTTFLIAGPLVGLFCGWWLARGFHRTIAQISITLQDAVENVDHQIGFMEVRSGGNLTGLHKQAQMVADHIRHVWEQLQETRRQVVSAERLAAVGELAAGIAHEVRNPLTSVKLLLQTAVPQESNYLLDEESFHVVEEEIAKVENTMQELLDFARPPKLRRVLHDLRRTIGRAINLVGGRATQQHIAITEEYPDQPVLVDGDPEQLHQIFVNLLLNGIEAMPQGGSLHIVVSHVVVSAVHGYENMCRVVVSDSGQGVPEHILPRIFEPFVSSKEQGTGLGLAISHRIANEHGGVLLAINRPEGGAVFTLELPTGVGEAVLPEKVELPTEELAVCAVSTSNHSEVGNAKTISD
jgi:signal transduction histidine kinase